MDNPLEDKKSAYDSEIRYTDEKFREIFEFLGWDDHTLLILTADHGEEFGDHGGQGHGMSLYREVIHVPLIIYFPPAERVHRRVAAQVSTLDILPTIQDYLGLKRAKIWAGKSQLSLIGHDPSQKSRRVIYSHLQLKTAGQPDRIAISALSESWKFIRNLNGSNELFNLEKDFLEKQSWYGQPGYREIAASLETQFLTFEKKCPKFEKQTASYAPSQKWLEKLKALGYVK
jgi:arylsulfatase A-like enzyme